MPAVEFYEYGEINENCLWKKSAFPEFLSNMPQRMVRVSSGKARSQSFPTPVWIFAEEKKHENLPTIFRANSKISFKCKKKKKIKVEWVLLGTGSWGAVSKKKKQPDKIDLNPFSWMVIRLNAFYPLGQEGNLLLHMSISRID